MREKEKEIEISDFDLKEDEEERISAVRSDYFDFKSNPSFYSEDIKVVYFFQLLQSIVKKTDH